MRIKIAFYDRQRPYKIDRAIAFLEESDKARDYAPAGFFLAQIAWMEVEVLGAILLRTAFIAPSEKKT